MLGHLQEADLSIAALAPNTSRAAAASAFVPSMTTSTLLDVQAALDQIG
jgi:hypothetical protein